MGIIDGTIEDGIQNASLAETDKFITPRIELAVRSKNASSGRIALSVTANSERGEHAGITAFLKT